VNLRNPLYIQYHDEEWGVPSYDDHHLFEMLLLESFQAGLSWECVLNKREEFRKAYDNFDVLKVAQYDSKKVEELLQNRGIIRNRFKIEASISNAKVFLQIQKEFGSFSNYIWSFSNGEVFKNETGKILSSNSLSDTISADLQRRGMKFVGTVIIYSYLQAIGIIYDHEACCAFYKGGRV
jgi:DNA-3-methyladenine glycosylase I